MPIKEQRVGKSMEKKLYGGRESTTLLYLGPPSTNFVSPRKKITIPGIPNHSNNSTVDYIASTHRQKKREEQQKAVQNNKEFQRLQQEKLERLRMEQEEKEREKKWQEIFDGRGLEINKPDRQPVQNNNQEEDETNNYWNKNFGRPGAGAPMRTDSGHLRTQLRTDPTLRSTSMNNGKTAEVEASRLRKLEKQTNGLNNSFGSSDGTLTARMGMREDTYDPWGKGSGNPRINSQGYVDATRGGNKPQDINMGTGLVTQSKYGGGGQPVRGPNGEIRATRISHFVKDASGNDQIRQNPVHKSGDPFGESNNNGMGQRGGTFASFTEATATPDDWKRGSPLEQEAKERKERLAKQKKVEQLMDNKKKK